MPVVAKDLYTPGFNFAGPVEHMLAVTPSDTDELATVGRKLYVTGAGNVKVLLRGDTVPVTIAVVAAQILDICVRKVFATGTTATGLVVGI